MPNPNIEPGIEDELGSRTKNDELGNRIKNLDLDGYRIKMRMDVQVS